MTCREINEIKLTSKRTGEPLDCVADCPCSSSSCFVFVSMVSHSTDLQAATLKGTSNKHHNNFYINNV